MLKRYVSVAVLALIIVLSVVALNSDNDANAQRSWSSQGDQSTGDTTNPLPRTADDGANNPARVNKNSRPEDTLNAVTRLSDLFVGGNSACNPRIKVCE